MLLGHLTYQRDSQWHMQDFVYGAVFSPFSGEPTRSEVHVYHPQDIFEISRIASVVKKLAALRLPENIVMHQRVS